MLSDRLSIPTYTMILPRFLTEVLHLALLHHTFVVDNPCYATHMTAMMYV